MTIHKAPDPQALAHEAARQAHLRASASSQQNSTYPILPGARPVDEGFVAGSQGQTLQPDGQNHGKAREIEIHQVQHQEQKQTIDRNLDQGQGCATGVPPALPPKIIERVPRGYVEAVQPNVELKPSQLPCILILGATGVGKSSFISATLGLSQVKIGHGVDSCTYHCHDWEGPNAILIDTPGFNDTNRDDQEVLAEIGSRILSNKLPRITAVLYLHRITDNRMSGSSLKNLKLMYALCGPSFYPRIVVVTTMWNRLPITLLDQADTRESNLKTYWKQILDGHGHYARFDGTREAGETVLGHLNGLASMDQRPLLQIEIDYKKGCSLIDTAAGLIIQEEKLKRQKQLQRQIEDSLEETPNQLRQSQANFAEPGMSFREMLGSWLPIFSERKGQRPPSSGQPGRGSSQRTGEGRHSR